MSERWIVIPRWRGTGDKRKTDGFQHFGDRDPIWIKNYTRLLRNDDYIGLTPLQRSCLHGLWLLYASKRGEVRESTRSLSRELGMRVTKTTLDALNHAGFIAFVDNKEVALRYWIGTSRREVEVETKPKGLSGAVDKSDGPLAANVRALFNPIIRQSDGTSPYTGCVAKRSVAGVKWEYDVLGTERPPPDWPHPTPSNAEIVAALEKERAA